MNLLREYLRRAASLARQQPKRAVLLALLVLLGIYALNSRGVSPAACDVLATAVIDRGPVQQEIFATGVVKPVEGAMVKTGARLTAKIEKMHVKLGDFVTEGQLIAELDARELVAERQRLEHTLIKLQTELDILEKNYPLDKEQAEASLKIAEADYDYATTILDRYLPLTKSRSVSLTDVDRARQQKTTAANNLIASNMALQKINMEYSLNVPHLKAQIAEVESELRSAEIRLSYASILSPMEGLVSEITAREGETLVAGMQVANLITVIDPQKLELQIFVDENDIGLVHPGSKVQFTVQTYQDKEFSGTVHLIHPAPEIRDNIVYYRALVRLEPEVAMVLRPEMTARCRVLAGSRENVVRVPNAAFKWVGGTQTLFSVDGGRVSPLLAPIGLSGSEMTELLDESLEGRTVATQMTLPSPLPPDWVKLLATETASKLGKAALPSSADKAQPVAPLSPVQSEPAQKGELSDKAFNKGLSGTDSAQNSEFAAEPGQCSATTQGAASAEDPESASQKTQTSERSGSQSGEISPARTPAANSEQSGQAAAPEIDEAKSPQPQERQAHEVR